MEDQAVQRWLEQICLQPAHAYFLTGDYELTQEAAKQACAALLCDLQQSPPCGSCQGCQWYLADSHPDFHHIQSETNRAHPIIRMETIRNLQEIIYQQPQKKYRVVWIEDVHTMRNEAQNALLKVLEEPPENLVFILSGQIGGVLPTVRSRCRIVRFNQVDRRVVSSENIKTAGDILMLLFRNGTQQAQKLLSEQKKEAVEVLYVMILLLREIIAMNFEAEILNDEIRKWAQEHKVVWTVSLLNDLLQDCLEAIKRLKANANVALCSDWLCIRARQRLNKKVN